MILYSVTNFFCYFILTSFPVGEGEEIRPQCAVFCRVAASPYPACGFVHEGRGGASGRNAPYVAGWRLRLTRPTGSCMGAGVRESGRNAPYFAGWRLRLTRPTGSCMGGGVRALGRNMCILAYPASGAVSRDRAATRLYAQSLHPATPPAYSPVHARRGKYPA